MQDLHKLQNNDRLIKAISDPRAHFLIYKHAIDFVLPEGSKILAPRAGTVVYIKVDSKEGGIDPKYNKMKYLNFMTLEHSNGEYSQYAHLKIKLTIPIIRFCFDLSVHVFILDVRLS